MTLCSVLIPSRGRPERLIKAIDSVFATADDPEQIEVSLRFDDDDQVSLDRMAEFRSYNIWVYIGPRKNGYYSLDEFYTHMAEQTDADWVWLMNDDAVIEGDGWDTQLAEIPTDGVIVQPELYQLGFSKYWTHEGGAFPIFPNRCWRKFGLQQMPHPVDTEMDKLLRSNGWTTQFLKGVGVIHDRDSEALENEGKLLLNNNTNSDTIAP